MLYLQMGDRYFLVKSEDLHFETRRDRSCFIYCWIITVIPVSCYFKNIRFLRFTLGFSVAANNHVNEKQMHMSEVYYIYEMQEKIAYVTGDNNT